MVMVIIALALATTASVGYLIYVCPPECPSYSTSTVSHRVAFSASIRASATNGTTPLSISFSALVTGGYAPYSYDWSLGDGHSSTSATPTETYYSPGNLLVQLTISDSHSETTSSDIVLLVSGSTVVTTSFISTSQPPVNGSINPPGLQGGWYSTNITVLSTIIAGPVTFDGLSISRLNASSQISYIAYGIAQNTAIVQLGFSSHGAASISMEAPEAPSSVWADSTQITSWNYNNGVLSIASDPSTITVYFPNNSETFLGLPTNIILLFIVAVIVAAAAGAAVRKH